MKTCYLILAAILLSGCIYAPELPKLVEITFATPTGDLTSMICIRNTRADARNLRYDCDTGKVYGKARGRMWEYHGEEVR